MIRRETGTTAWASPPALLAGTQKSDDTSGTQTFSDEDDAQGLRRGRAALPAGQQLRAGRRLTQPCSPTTTTRTPTSTPASADSTAPTTSSSSASPPNVGVRQFPHADQQLGACGRAGLRLVHRGHLQPEHRRHRRHHRHGSSARTSTSTTSASRSPAATTACAREGLGEIGVPRRAVVFASASSATRIWPTPKPAVSRPRRDAPQPEARHDHGRFRLARARSSRQGDRGRSSARA